MKLTYNQRRWALASVLMFTLTAVTAFDHKPEIAGSRDLASTQASDSIDARLTTDQGVVNVKYIKDGDKVSAFVPRTEGQATCDYCGTYSFDVKFEEAKSNLDSLNVALMREFRKKNTTEEVTPTAITPVAESEESGLVRAQIAAFEAIEAKCERKADTKAICLTEELGKLIQKDKNLNPEETVEFYKFTVQPAISEMITKSLDSVKDLSSFNSRSSGSYEENYLMGIDSFEIQMDRQEYLDNLRETRESIEDNRKAISEALRSLIKVSGKHPMLRAAIVKDTTEVVKQSALQVREIRAMAVEALQRRDHATFNQKSAEADNLRSVLMDWSRSSVSGMEMGLDYLRDRQEISRSDRNVYETYINNYNKMMTQILANPRYNADGTVYMEGLNLTPSQDIYNQISREGGVRIDDVRAQVSPEMMSRIRAEEASMRIPDYLNPNLNSSGSTSGQNGFYVDGPAYQATPEMLRERQQIRSRYGM